MIRTAAACALALASAWASSACCNRSNEPWRGCTLCAEQGKLAALERQADPGRPTLSAAPHCARLATNGNLPDEPEPIDDLDGVLDRGVACGPSGHKERGSVCPALAEHGWKLVSGPTALSTAASCAPAAQTCPNQAVVLAHGDEAALTLEFYDDPSSHRSGPSLSCADGSQLSPCYYRLLRVSRGRLPLTVDTRM